MAKTLRYVIVQLSEGPGSAAAGVLDKAMARYVCGDSSDPNFQTAVKFKEVAAPNFGQTTQAFYDGVVAQIRLDEGIA